MVRWRLLVGLVVVGLVGLSGSSALGDVGPYCNTGVNPAEWYTRVNNCAAGTNQWTWYYGGYTSIAQADAARNAAGFTNSQTSWYVGSYIYVSYGFKGEAYPCNGGNNGQQGIFYALLPGYDAGPCNDLTDSDNDGLVDSIDPYPDDPTPFRWGKFYEVRNGSGVLQGVAIKTDRGDVFWYGDESYIEECLQGANDCQKRMFVNLGDETPLEDVDLESYVGADDITSVNPESSSNVVDGEREVSPASGIESGVSSQGSTDQTTLLQRIADNTAKTATNLQAVGDRLKAIEQETRGVNQSVVGAGSGAGAATGAEVQSSVGNALASNDQARESAAESGYDTELSGVANFNAGEYPTEGYGESDVPEKSLLSDVWDSFLTDNPVATLIGSTGVDASGGSCSFSVTVPIGSQSREISFSFCEYEDVVDGMGVLVYGLSVLCGILLLATGKF